MISPRRRPASTIVGTFREFAPQSFQQWFRDRARPRSRHAWRRSCCGRTRSPIASIRRSHRPRSRSSSRPDGTCGCREQKVCCGLTWISTGQLKTARRVLTRTIDILRPHVRAGGLVLGLEPSCTAVFRSDATELFPNDPDVDRLRQQTVTFAELLDEHTPGWTPPKITAARDRANALSPARRHGLRTRHARSSRPWVSTRTVLDSGCCGLAGNFGFETGSLRSVRGVRRTRAPPRGPRTPQPRTSILADGFSCRTQIAQSDSARAARSAPCRAHTRREAARLGRDPSRSAQSETSRVARHDENRRPRSQGVPHPAR